MVTVEFGVRVVEDELFRIGATSGQDFDQFTANDCSAFSEILVPCAQPSSLPLILPPDLRDLALFVGSPCQLPRRRAGHVEPEDSIGGAFICFCYSVPHSSRTRVGGRGPTPPCPYLYTTQCPS